MRLQSEIDVTVQCHKCRKRLTEDLNLTMCEEVGHPAIYVNPCDCKPEPCKRCAELESELAALRAEHENCASSLAGVANERNRLQDERSNLAANLRLVRSERDAARADFEAVCSPDDPFTPLELADIVPGWYVIRDDGSGAHLAGLAVVRVVANPDIHMWRVMLDKQYPLTEKGVTFLRRLVLEDAPKPAPAETPIRVGQVWDGKHVTNGRGATVIYVNGSVIVLWTTAAEPNMGWSWDTTPQALREGYRLVSEPAS